LIIRIFMGRLLSERGMNRYQQFYPNLVAVSTKDAAQQENQMMPRLSFRLILRISFVWFTMVTYLLKSH